VALAGAARSSLAGVLPAFALVLALSLGTFAGMVSQAITRGEIAASWQSTAADVAISTATSAPITPAAEQAIAAVPGVRRLTATWNTSWITPGNQPVTVVAVDSASYAALVASTPFPAVPVAKLGTAAPGTGTVSVLASPAALASAACALALPPLIGSALDLSVFTGSGTPVPLRPDWIWMALPAAAAVLLAAAALATQARRLRRHGVTRMLRAE
jgi:hypothetical protein